MFDKPILPAESEPAGENALRAPAWDELVARLAAAQDLRDELASRARRVAGNFNRFGVREGEPGNHAERSVNPDDLAHGKARGGKVAAAADGAVTGDRETQ